MLYPISNKTEILSILCKCKNINKVLDENELNKYKYLIIIDNYVFFLFDQKNVSNIKCKCFKCDKSDKTIIDDITDISNFDDSLIKNFFEHEYKIIVDRNDMFCENESIYINNNDKKTVLFINNYRNETLKDVRCIANGSFSKAKTTDKFIEKIFIDEIDDYSFVSCDVFDKNVSFTCNNKMGIGAFYDCQSLCNISLNLQNNIIELPYDSFVDCCNLSSVDITNTNIKKIGHNAFENCKNLIDINLPDSLEEIEDEAFKWCKSLKTICLPKNIKKINYNCFYGCDSLISIYIQNARNLVDIDCSNYMNYKFKFYVNENIYDEYINKYKNSDYDINIKYQFHKI